MEPITDHTVTSAERFRNLSHIVQLLDFAGSLTPFRGTDGGAYLSVRIGFDGQCAAPPAAPSCAVS